MNVCIVGGGNIGTQFAVHCASKGHNTKIYTKQYKLFSTELSIVNEKNEVKLKGKVFATDDKKQAFEDVDLVFVTVPAFLMEKTAQDICPYLKESTIVGLVPGTGGGECAFKKYSNNKLLVFGLQRVPSVARLVKYGETVRTVGYRSALHIASMNKNVTGYCSDIVSSIFEIDCIQLPNYLNITLTPSNPIFHTTRLYSIFQDYEAKNGYESIPLFYEDWTDESSKLLLECDEEVQVLCRALKDFDLSYVKSLKEHYESDTPEKLTKKIKSIAGFKGLTTPSKVVNGLFVPDLESRYFTADFSFGLEIIVQLADIANVEVSNCKKVLNWYKTIKKDSNKFSYSEYGINNLEDLIELYNK